MVPSHGSGLRLTHDYDYTHTEELADFGSGTDRAHCDSSRVLHAKSRLVALEQHRDGTYTQAHLGATVRVSA